MIIAAFTVTVAGQPFGCRILSIRDGHGPFHCANGVPVRLAGVQAPSFVPSRNRLDVTANRRLDPRSGASCERGGEIIVSICVT